MSVVPSRPFMVIGIGGFHPVATSREISAVSNATSGFPVTPLRIVFGLSWPLSLRRLLGLFALFYASLHFGVWIALDHYFDWVARRLGRSSGEIRIVAAVVVLLLPVVPVALFEQGFEPNAGNIFVF